MKISHKTIQSHIVEELPKTSVVADKLVFHAFEVESFEETADDAIYDIQPLPDRANDCKTDYGIAREVANLFGLTLKVPSEYSVDGNENTTVDFTPADISKYLGYEITLDQIKSVLDQFHYQYSVDGQAVHFIVPAWRTDLVNIQDMTEEIGRVLGYEHIPAILPKLDQKPAINSVLAAILKRRIELLNQGYHEVITYTFRETGDFELLDALSDKNHLRVDLLGGLRIAYAENMNRLPVLPNMSARVFEIGSVFPKSGEEMHVAWIDEKGEHEEKLEIGNVDSYIFEPGNIDHHFKMWSIYPAMTRDIAVWIPTSENGDALVKIIKENATDLLLGEPKLFDQFTKEDRTSYGYRLVFQSFDRTLTIDEVNKIMEIITEKIKEKGWEVR
jgi:phenylalanyl-tRNA synthetase beta subunit